MKSLLFVESPLQLLNAYEAIQYFSLTDYKIFIRYSNNLKNDEQIRFILQKLKIKNSIEFTIKSESKQLSDYLKLFLWKYRFLFKTDVDKLFIGNYDSGFLSLIMKQFKKEQIILLDDGAKTLSIQNGFTQNNFYSLFTMYKLEPFNSQKIYKNEYINISNSLQSLQKDETKVLFLGTKLSESEIITEKYYLDLIHLISKYYKDKKIIYIVHRGESEENLRKIKQYKNITVKYLDYPVELYGLYEKEIPSTIASFYSTALYTMKNIYNLEANSFTFDYTSSKHVNAIKSVYEYYKKYLKVIELND